MIYTLKDLEKIDLKLKPWYKIFLYWDLWAGKTTIIKYILKNILWDNINITSPTYIHYKKYDNNIYHFDLYRLENYDDFINIGWEEIVDNGQNICFIEWPQIIEEIFKPNIKIILNKVLDNENERDIEIIYC